MSMDFVNKFVDRCRPKKNMCATPYFVVVDAGHLGHVIFRTVTAKKKIIMFTGSVDKSVNLKKKIISIYSESLGEGTS